MCLISLLHIFLIVIKSKYAFLPQSLFELIDLQVIYIGSSNHDTLRETNLQFGTLFGNKPKHPQPYCLGMVTLHYHLYSPSTSYNSSVSNANRLRIYLLK